MQRSRKTPPLLHHVHRPATPLPRQRSIRHRPLWHNLSRNPLPVPSSARWITSLLQTSPTTQEQQAFVWTSCIRVWYFACPYVVGADFSAAICVWARDASSGNATGCITGAKTKTQNTINYQGRRKTTNFSFYTQSIRLYSYNNCNSRGRLSIISAKILQN